MLKSPKANTLAAGLIERTSSLLDETESKNKHKEGDQKRKKRKTLIEVKPVENMSKKLWSFLEISTVQKKVLLFSHKLQDHGCE